MEHFFNREHQPRDSWGMKQMNNKAQLVLFTMALVMATQSVIAADSGRQAVIRKAQVTPALQTPAAIDAADGEVTEAEKNVDEAATQQSNKYAEEQAAAVNTVPGVAVSPEDIKEKPAKKKGFSLNPIKWIFGPLIKLQEQTVRLQQQMMKLTGPIAALQPAMLKLRQRVESMGVQMDGVQSELRDLRSDMNAISSRLDTTLQHMKGVDKSMQKVSMQLVSMQGSLKGTYGELQQMRPDLSTVRQDIGLIRDPIMRVHRPLQSIVGPIHNLDKQVMSVSSNIRQIKPPLVHMERPLVSLDRSMTGVDKEITGLHKEIVELRNLITMVLTSIFLAAVLIAIGTPIAAILVWRNKHKLLPKPKSGESSEDDLAAGGAKTTKSSRPY